MRAQDLPSFKDLPPVKGMPHGCAWGIWDKNGEKDQLGALNLLTPEVVAEAGKEIQSGDRCVLKYSSNRCMNVNLAQLGIAVSGRSCRGKSSLSDYPSDCLLDTCIRGFR